MLRVTSTADRVEIVRQSRMFLVLGALFVILGVASLAGAIPGGSRQAGWALLVVGFLPGFLPWTHAIRADRGKGELTCTWKSLFSSGASTEKLSEIEAVAVSAGAYVWSFSLRKRGGGEMPLYTRMKSGSVATKELSADILAEAHQLADALALPLDR